MIDDVRVIDLRGDITALRALFNEHNTAQQSLMRELGGILNTVSSALSASHQIASADREHLLSRLEGITQLLSQDRRDGGDTLRRMESVLASLERDVRDILTDRQEDRDRIGDIHRGSESMGESLERVLEFQDEVLPLVKEAIRHARLMVDRDPETGSALPMMERIIQGLQRAFWMAVATAVILLLASSLLPWVRGIRLHDQAPSPAHTLTGP